MHKILIVDDEAPIRTLLRLAVAGTGVAIFEADGGSRAIEIAAEEGPFSLVVTDVLMPGMDGFELADKLCRAGHASRFLFVSGFYDAEMMSDRMQSFPASAFLSKPFPIPALLRAVREALPQEDGGLTGLRRSA